MRNYGIYKKLSWNGMRVSEKNILMPSFMAGTFHLLPNSPPALLAKDFSHHLNGYEAATAAVAAVTAAVARYNFPSIWMKLLLRE